MATEKGRVAEYRFLGMHNFKLSHAEQLVGG